MSAAAESTSTLLGRDPVALDVHGLCVRYGGVSAVRDLTFRVDAGEAVGIIGANGAGKTSTLKALLGLVSRTAEHVRLGDRELLRTPAHRMVRLGVGYVPEGRHVFPGLTVRKNLLLGAFTRRWSDCGGQLEEVYGLFPVLRDMQDRLAGALSGGQQQMLAIGRALMAQPRLLVLDEPSMGLSPLLVDGILDVLKRLHGLGLSILLVEQNAKLTFEATDRCLVMEDGRAVKHGPAGRLRQDPDVRRIYLGI